LSPWLSNFSARLFSVTVRTTLPGVPSGTSASISSVTVTSAPTSPERWATTSSAIRLASRPTRVVSRVTAPWNRRGLFRGGAASVGRAPVRMGCAERWEYNSARGDVGSGAAGGQQFPLARFDGA